MKKIILLAMILIACLLPILGYVVWKYLFASDDYSIFPICASVAMLIMALIAGAINEFINDDDY